MLQLKHHITKALPFSSLIEELYPLRKARTELNENFDKILVMELGHDPDFPYSKVWQPYLHQFMSILPSYILMPKQYANGMRRRLHIVRDHELNSSKDKLILSVGLINDDEKFLELHQKLITHLSLKNG